MITTLWHIGWTLFLILGAFALFLAVIFVLLLFVNFVLEYRDTETRDEAIRIQNSEHIGRTGQDY